MILGFSFALSSISNTSPIHSFIVNEHMWLLSSATALSPFSLHKPLWRLVSVLASFPPLSHSTNSLQADVWPDHSMEGALATDTGDIRVTKLVAVFHLSSSWTWITFHDLGPFLLKAFPSAPSLHSSGFSPTSRVALVYPGKPPLTSLTRASLSYGLITTCTLCL